MRCLDESTAQAPAVPVSVEEGLRAAMRAVPDDDATKLVYADMLLSEGDARGELIILDLQDRRAPDGLTDARAIARLLVLAAEHGFPRLPDDPDHDVLPFTGGGSHPVQYDLDHTDGHAYYLRWRYGFSIDVDHVTVLEADLDVSDENDWTHEETNVILAIVSRAIREGSVAQLVFPTNSEIRAHSHYRVGRNPLYGFPDELTLAQGPHAAAWRLQARDFDRWHALWQRAQAMRRR